MSSKEVMRQWFETVDREIPDNISTKTFKSIN